MQIFEVLRSIGGYHSFSAGLVIGGKNVKDERDRLSRMNILVKDAYGRDGRRIAEHNQPRSKEQDEADKVKDKASPWDVLYVSYEAVRAYSRGSMGG